jgi:peptidoglycan hydrolase CwlO-like protein
MITQDLQKLFASFEAELDHKSSEVSDLSFKNDELRSKNTRLSIELESIKATVTMLQEMVKKQTHNENIFRQLVLDVEQVSIPELN